jgi:hypothetical protein
MSPGRDREVAETIHVTGQNFEEARIADIVNARAS